MPLLALLGSAPRFAGETGVDARPGLIRPGLSERPLNWFEASGAVAGPLGRASDNLALERRSATLLLRFDGGRSVES